MDLPSPNQFWVTLIHSFKFCWVISPFPFVSTFLLKVTLFLNSLKTGVFCPLCFRWWQIMQSHLKSKGERIYFSGNDNTGHIWPGLPPLYGLRMPDYFITFIVCLSAIVEIKAAHNGLAGGFPSRQIHTSLDEVGWLFQLPSNHTLVAIFQREKQILITLHCSNIKLRTAERITSITRRFYVAAATYRKT